MVLVLIDMAGRDDAPDAGRGVHIGIRADDGAGVQDAVAADLHIIAEDSADLLAAGLDVLGPVFDDDERFITLAFDVMEPAPMWDL